MKEVACSDVGFDCDFVVRAQTPEGVLSAVAVHAKEAHPDVELTDDLVAEVKDSIREV